MAYIQSNACTDTRRPARRGGLLAALAARVALARQRRQLGQLDATRLRDIGLSPEDAQAEARRPAWDVPATWRD